MFFNIKSHKNSIFFILYVLKIYIYIFIYNLVNLKNFT